VATTLLEYAVLHEVIDAMPVENESCVGMLKLLLDLANEPEAEAARRDLCFDPPIEATLDSGALGGPM